MQIYMQKPALTDQSLRFCNLLLQQDLLGGWTLIREAGLYGRAGRVERHQFSDWERANEALITMRDAQLGKGFRVMFVRGEGSQQL